MSNFHEAFGAAAEDTRSRLPFLPPLRLTLLLVYEGKVLDGEVRIDPQ